MSQNAGVIDSIIFSEIFGNEEMRAIWSDRARIQCYLDIEAALAKTQSRLGMIPTEACDEIVRHCHVEEMDIAKLRAQTKRIGYPVLPVVQQLVALCTDGLGQWCHWGATTQDITDTATVMQIRSSLDLVESELEAVADVLAALAKKHRDTPMIGRSNLQQAVPITFGYKAAVWLSGIDRHRDRLREIRPRSLVGEFGGAVGTLATLGDRGLAAQEGLMRELGLSAPLIAWHTMRDVIAEIGCFLGLVCGTLDKIAFDVKVMMATELDEVMEPGGGGRGTSSTMPQKRNPISCAYITACSAVVRQYSAALLAAMAADFERSTGAWEIEWIVLPEIFGLSAGALSQARFMLSGIEVQPSSMARNLDLTSGLVCTEAVMMALAPKIGRQLAHDCLAKVCEAVCDGKGTLIDLLLSQPEIGKIIDRHQLEVLVEPRRYLGLSGLMVDRVIQQHTSNTN